MAGLVVHTLLTVDRAGQARLVRGLVCSWWAIIKTGSPTHPKPKLAGSTDAPTTITTARRTHSWRVAPPARVRMAWWATADTLPLVQVQIGFALESESLIEAGSTVS